MIERHVTFEVEPSKAGDFEQFCITEYLTAMATMPGFASASLLREHDQASTYEMVIRFDTSQSAADWRTSQAHTMLKPRMRELSTSKELKVYEVIE